MPAYRQPRAYDVPEIDPFAGVKSGAELGNALRTDVARTNAGNALLGGDYTAAAGALYGAGDLESGSKVQALQRERAEANRKLEKERHDEALKFTADAAERLREYHNRTKDPAKLAAAWDSLAPRFKEYGETDAEIAEARAQLLANPEATLLAMGAGGDKIELKQAGDEILAFRGGTLLGRYMGGRIVNVAENGAAYRVPGTGGTGAEAPEGQPPPATVATAAPGPVGPAPTATRDPGAAALAAVDGLTRGGARVTSGLRTPADNRRVRGVPNSDHLTDQARDLVPPPGVSLAEFERQVRAAMPPGVEVVPEPARGHIHVEWGPGARNQGPRPVAAAPAAAAPPADPGAPQLLVSRPRQEDRQYSPAEVTAKGYPEGTVAFDTRNGDRVTYSPPASGTNRKVETDLRKEFNARPEVKEFRDVSTSYNTIKGLFAKAPSPATDIAAIFSFMKMLDPGSVVREGEFATAEKAGGVPERIRNQYNKLLKGERLSPRQRQDFLNQAESIYSTRNRRFGELAREYRGYAAGYDVDPDAVVTDTPAAPAAAAPARQWPAPVPKSLERLRKNPTPAERGMFEAAYGPGSAAKALGGK